MTDKEYMMKALSAARKGIRQGQTPFGACIVKNGRVVANCHNRVWDTTDITAHAEIVAIREACLKLRTISLDGCVIYSTCEPCPMCFSAIHWARISKIVYGTTIRDAQKTGFHELCISNRTLREKGKSKVEIRGPYMRKESMAVFEAFLKKSDGRLY